MDINTNTLNAILSDYIDRQFKKLSAEELKENIDLMIAIYFKWKKSWVDELNKILMGTAFWWETETEMENINSAVKDWINNIHWISDEDDKELSRRSITGE